MKRSKTRILLLQLNNARYESTSLLLISYPFYTIFLRLFWTKMLIIIWRWS